MLALDDGVGTRWRMALSMGVGPEPVYASPGTAEALRRAEDEAQIAAGLLPAGLTSRRARLAELLQVDQLGRAAVHQVLRDIADAQAQLHALQAAAISRLAAVQPAQPALPGARDGDPVGHDRPDDWVADEVAVVLGIGIGSAAVLVDKQRALFEQLPQVWAAVADSGIDVRRCQVLTDALAHRRQSAGGGLADDVVDRVAAQGIGWIREGLGPTPLGDRIGGALIAADPAEAERRAERRRRKQNVTTVGCGDGLAGLRADLLDAGDAAAMQAVVDAMAAVMHKAGDRRPIGQLRVAALQQLLTRPWEALPDEVARACWHLRLRVDLSDLDDLGPLVDPPEGARPSRDAGPAPESALPDHGSCAASIPEEDEIPAATCGRGSGSGVGALGGLPVSPGAVAELLARFDALAIARPTGQVDGGDVWFEIVDGSGRLQAIASPAEARTAVRRGTGLGPPPEIQGYVPSAAQVRFVRARDRHCRFPGCSRPAEYADLDHVVPRNHEMPAAGGATCVTNLICLCRRHHRLKTHAAGWVFAMEPDGTLHVTPPGGRTRTTRPASIAEVAVATDPFVELFGATPKRYRTPTPDERATRRATARERAELAAIIDARLAAAGAAPPPF